LDAPESVRQAGAAWSWLALLAGTPVACWHVGLPLTPGTAHVLGGLGLALAVLAAATASRWAAETLLAHHVLAVGIGLTGVVVLPAALLTARRIRIQARSASEGHGSPLACASGLCSEPSVRGWVAAIALLVAGLALRGVPLEPTGAWWPASAIFAVA